jgi:hypothetical protein
MRSVHHCLIHNTLLSPPEIKIELATAVVCPWQAMTIAACVAIRYVAGCAEIANSRTKKGLKLLFDQVQIGFPSKLSLDFALAVDQKSQWEAEHSSI